MKFQSIDKESISSKLLKISQSDSSFFYSNIYYHECCWVDGVFGCDIFN